jgi:hypothetical protein
VDSAERLRAAQAFEAMLLVPLLRPMLPASDAFGEYGLSIVARDIASHDRSGFAGMLADAFERFGR